ncbi:MAG: hypothetical protein UU47_C0002G0023 [candidate division TM6 bacterium GW2011_GWE2_41_16]|nr:MAG: hypothetical protein UU47_C0002G0023 [candidate division TM6 bacterium GW2011_GWE2_41_16]
MKRLFALSILIALTCAPVLKSMEYIAIPPFIMTITMANGLKVSNVFQTTNIRDIRSSLEPLEHITINGTNLSIIFCAKRAKELSLTMYKLITAFVSTKEHPTPGTVAQFIPF